MLDLFVELRGAGQLLKELADNDTITRDYLLETIGDKLLTLADRVEEIEAENVSGLVGKSIPQEQHFTA